ATCWRAASLHRLPTWRAGFAPISGSTTNRRSQSGGAIAIPLIGLVVLRPIQSTSLIWNDPLSSAHHGRKIVAGCDRQALACRHTSSSVRGGAQGPGALEAPPAGREALEAVPIL